jgi:hypothetical protein
MFAVSPLVALYVIAVSLDSSQARRPDAHPLVGRWCHVVWEGGRPESGTVLSIDDQWLILRADQEPDQPELWIPRSRIKGLAAFATHPSEARRVSGHVGRFVPPGSRYLVSRAIQGF